MNGNTARPERRGYNKEDATMKKLIALALATLMLLSMLPTALAAEYKDKATVKDVQQALNDAGYDCGKPDGAAGKKTKAAITAYQTDKGLEVTGVIDDALLESLGVELSDEDAPAEDAQAESASDEVSPEEEISPEVPQEIADLIDLPDGLPDTLDGLAEKYDLETLGALYEQLDFETILHDLLEQGTATLPDLGVEWTEASIENRYVDGNDATTVSNDLALDSVEGVTTISLDDEYLTSEDSSFITLVLYFEGGYVYRDYENNKGTLKDPFGEAIYVIIAGPMQTADYRDLTAELYRREDEYAISIDAQTKEGRNYVGWYCEYDKENGELKDRHHIAPTGEWFAF